MSSRHRPAGSPATAATSDAAQASLQAGLQGGGALDYSDLPDLHRLLLTLNDHERSQVREFVQFLVHRRQGPMPPRRGNDHG